MAGRARVQLLWNFKPRGSRDRANGGGLVEFVTSVDAAAGKALWNPTAGEVSGVRVVRREEDSWWRDQTLGKHIMQDGDATTDVQSRKFREDMANLPEEPTWDQYRGLPVEEFGEAVLRGMGWEEGKPIGRNCTTLVEPHELVPRGNFRSGLGAAPTPPRRSPR